MGYLMADTRRTKSAMASVQVAEVLESLHAFSGHGISIRFRTFAENSSDISQIPSGRAVK